MTSICFIRHGETEANRMGRFAGRTDLGLNENGVRQARETAEKLRGECFDAVYCGCTKRVRETFEIVRPAITFPEENLFFTDQIREIDFGKWENLTAAEIELNHADEWNRYLAGWTDYTFPGGDGNRAYFERCAGFIHKVADIWAGQTIAVFAHKGFTLACICALKGLPMERMFDSDIQNGSFFLLNLPE